MKLENCGRCGHEAVIKDGSVQPCPCCGNCPDGEFYPDFAEWDKAQRLIRTERINAASLAMKAGYYANPAMNWQMDDPVCVQFAEDLIAVQDQAAQARFERTAKEACGTGRSDDTREELTMAHENPGDGRTDAELLARFERWWSWEGVGTSPAYGQDQDECNYNLTRTAWLNGAYVAQELSGTRPMPTDPEVAALKARVAELEAGLLDLYEATGVAGAHIPDAQYAAVARAAALLSKPAPGAGKEGRGE